MSSNQIGKGILLPADLSVLHRVVARVCALRYVQPDSNEGLDIAVRVLFFHEQGVTDEDALISMAMGRLERSDHAPDLRSKARTATAPHATGSFAHATAQSASR